MPINNLSLRDTYGAGIQDAQNQQINALNMDARKQQMNMAQQQFSAEQQRANTEKLLAGIRLVKTNPGMLPQVGADLAKAGVLNEQELPGLMQRAQTNPEQFMQGLSQLESQLQYALGQAPAQPTKADLIAVMGDNGPEYVTAPQALNRQPVSRSASAAKPPASIAEYELAKSEGYKGTFQQWQNERARGQVIEVDGGKYILNPVTKEYHPISTAKSETDAAATRASAIETAKAEAEAAAKEAQLTEANRRTLDVWRAARAGLISALEGTTTGPVAGRVPAVTAPQQTAEGAIAAVAPVLKQLFRSAGEGIFTDRDQQLLLDMVPKRTDHPETRKSKMEMIDAIIEAKLGKGVNNTELSKPSFRYNPQTGQLEPS